MKYITKLKLAAVHQLCDADDRSTEFMIQYMQDVCKVSHDTVESYLLLPHKEHKKLFKEVMDFASMFEILDC
jgi:hypothetical protein